MAKSKDVSGSFTLKWDQEGQRYYENGVSYVALYVAPGTGETAATGSSYKEGVSWSGITAINESAEGGDITKLYADNEKFLSLTADEKFSATIEAYTYPDAWKLCDGSMTASSSASSNQYNVSVTGQPKRSFGLAYLTEVGNDTNGYISAKLHIVYGLKAKPSSRDNKTINDSPEALTFSWDVEATSVQASDLNRGKSCECCHIVFDKQTMNSNQWNALLLKIFGSATGTGDAAKAILPSPATLKTLLASA